MATVMMAADLVLVPAPLPRCQLDQGATKGLASGPVPCAWPPGAFGWGRVVRILSSWPSADALLGAYRRLDLIVWSIPGSVSGHRRCSGTPPKPS